MSNLGCPKCGAASKIVDRRIEYNDYMCICTECYCPFFTPERDIVESSGLEDSGQREDYGTGAVRDVETGKGRYDLIPPLPLKRLAQHYENGALKYQDRNWEKGIPVSRCFSSAVRHLYRWLDGERGEDHLAAAVWNIFAMMHHEVHFPELVDVPMKKEVSAIDGHSDDCSYTAPGSS